MKLIRAGKENAEQIWKMQIEAFSELLERYRDYDTNPGNEPVERIAAKLSQPYTYFYSIVVDDETVGAIRVVDPKDGSRKRIAPLFVLKQYRNKGYAQLAMQEAERIHGKDNWKLDTILQEAGNCHLYEKMGYRRTGVLEPINEKMTLVYYEKD